MKFLSSIPVHMVIACHRLLNGSCTVSWMVLYAAVNSICSLWMTWKKPTKAFVPIWPLRMNEVSHESGHTTNLQNNTMYTWFVWSWRILSLSCSVSVLICSFNHLNYFRCPSLSFKVCQSHWHRFWECCFQPWWARAAFVRWKSISLLLY